MNRFIENKSPFGEEKLRELYQKEALRIKKLFDQETDELSLQTVKGYSSPNIRVPPEERLYSLEEEKHLSSHAEQAMAKVKETKDMLSQLASFLISKEPISEDI